MSQVKAKQLEGVHADQLLDNLITATVDPTVNDDVALGYKPSSLWVNTTANPNSVFICSDNSIGAAVWIEIKEIPVAPSSTPLGYNDMRTSFTGANWDYEGLTNNGGGISLSGSVVVPGAIAGWRYLVVDTLGVVSVETIPPAEIIADTQQYSPTPVFDVANNGYFSSVNPTYRIIAIGYFDGTNLLETISYGNGKRKNDDWYFTPNLSTSTGIPNERLQLDAAFDRSRGTNFTVIDNGIGVTDSEGGRITIVGNSGFLVLDVNLVASSFTDFVVHINKKGVFYDRVDAYQTYIAVITSFTRHTTMRIPVQKGDYFVMNAAAIATGSVAIESISITFEEN